MICRLKAGDLPIPDFGTLKVRARNRELLNPEPETE